MIGEVEEESLAKCLRRTIKTLEAKGEHRARIYPRTTDAELESLELLVVVPMSLRQKYLPRGNDGDDKAPIDFSMRNLPGYKLEEELAKIRATPLNEWPYEVTGEGCSDGEFNLTDRQVANVMALWHELMDVHAKIGGKEPISQVLERPELEGPNGLIAPLIPELNDVVAQWQEYAQEKYYSEGKPREL